MTRLECGGSGVKRAVPSPSSLSYLCSALFPFQELRERGKLGKLAEAIKNWEEAF